MKKFEIELIIDESLEMAFDDLAIENKDILDEDDDGLITWASIDTSEELEAIKQFLAENAEIEISTITVEHRFADHLKGFKTSPCDDDSFAVEIETAEELAKFLSSME